MKNVEKRPGEAVDASAATEKRAFGRLVFSNYDYRFENSNRTTEFISELAWYYCVFAKTFFGQILLVNSNVFENRRSVNVFSCNFVAKETALRETAQRGKAPIGELLIHGRKDRFHCTGYKEGF